MDADLIRIDLQWSTLWSEWTVDVLAVDRLHLTIIREADESTNLPSSPETLPESTTTTSTPPRINIERIDIRGLEARFQDRASNSSVEATVVNGSFLKDAAATRGALTFSEPVRIRWRDRETSLRIDQATMAFDGRDVAIENISGSAPEGTLTVHGHVSSVLSAPHVAIDYVSTIDPKEAGRWIDSPGWSGAIDAEGQLQGSATAPVISLQITSRDLVMPRLGSASLTAFGALSNAEIRLEDLDLSVAGGRLSGSMHVEIDNSGRLGNGGVRLTWRALDLDRLLGAWLPDPPIRFASVLEGGLEATWPRLDPQVVTASFENSMRAVASPGLKLGGQTALRAKDGLWTLEAQHEIIDGPRVDAHVIVHPADVFTQSPLTGSIRVVSERLDSAASLLALSRRGGAQDSWPVQGRIRATGTLGGTITVPQLELSLDGQDLRYLASPPTTLEAELTLEPALLHVTALTARTDLATLEATGRIDMAQRRLAATVELMIGDLTRWAHLFPTWVAPSGSMAIHGTASGSLKQPTVRISTTATSAGFAGQRVQRLSARARLDRRLLKLEELHLLQDGGALTASGNFDLKTHQYMLAVKGESLTLRPLPPTKDEAVGLAAEGVSLEFEGQGSLDDPEGQGRVRAATVTWNGIDQGPLDGFLVVGDQSVSVELEAHRLRARAHSVLSVAGEGAFDRFRIEAQLADTPVSDLIRLAGIETSLTVTGTLSVGGRARGHLSDLGAADIEANVSTLDFSVDDTRVRLDRQASFRYDGSAVFVGDFAASLGGSTLRIDGALGSAQPGLTAAVSGDLQDFENLAALARGDAQRIEMHGGLSLTIRATGAFDSPMLEAEFSATDASITSPPMAPLTIAVLRGSVRDGITAIAELRANWQEAVITATASLPIALLGDRLLQESVEALPASTQGLRASITFQSITPAVLSGFVDTELLDQIDGRVAGTLTVEGDALALDRLHGELELTEAAFEFSGVPISQQRPTRLTLEQGQFQIDTWIWRGLTTDIELSGGASLGEELSLDVRAIGRVDLRLLAAFLPGTSTAGHADIGIIVHGLAADPAIDGTIIVVDGELRLPKPRVIVSALDATLGFDRRRLVIRALAADVNGGTLTAGGEIKLSDPFEGNLGIQIREMALAYPLGLQSEFDADLAFDVREKGFDLTGSVTVLRGIYKERITLAGGLLAALRQQQTTATTVEGSMLKRLRLDVQLSTLEEIVVDNNLARLQLTGNGRLVGTAARPALLARAALVEGGLVFLSGNVYEIETGSVDFTNASRIEPQLTLRARTRVRGYEVTLAAEGTPDTLTTNLSADDPRLTESDVVSLLLTGRTTAELGGARGDLAREQALTLIGGDLFNAAGRTLGLDTVRVERGASADSVRFDPSLIATETNPGSRLTFGKQLTREVELIYSQSLRENGSATWIVSYTPLPNIQIRGIVRDDSDRSYEFRHSLSFGGSETVSVVRRQATESPRVTAVQFIGQLGVPEEELRDELELEATDRFNFYEWQDDRDRLQQYYTKRGFREARVRARRRQGAGSEPGVTLEYAIESGPLTSLTVEGYDLPASVRQELEDAWTRSVVDDFLFEDLVSRLRLFLVGDGYLRGNATVEVRSDSPELKEIHVEIDPGPRSVDWQVAFTSNAIFSTEELLALVQQFDLGHEAWLDPRRLEQTITARYASEGLLDATVRVQPPEYRDDTAVLPVVIDEGPLFRISDIALTGAESLAPDTVRESADLSVGDVFSDSRLEDARFRIDRDYRRSGFNAVEVLTERVVDREEAASVAIAFTIREGARHVLKDVRVSGSRRTRPSLIANALRLRIGDPVNLGEWYDARKRLYDTGVFRSVEISAEPMSEPDAGGAEPVRAEVELREWPPLQLRYGFQVNDELAPAADATKRYSLGVGGDLTYRNLLGRAANAGISGRYSKRFGAARVFLSMPAVFGLPVLSDVFLSRSHEELGEDSASPFVNDKVGLTLEQRFRPADDFLVTYGYTFERNHAYELNAKPDDPFAFDITIDVARLNLATIVDSRDDLMDATRGWFHSSSVEYAPEQLGSDLRFAKYLTQHFHYQGGGGGVVLASAARLGLGAGFGQDLIPSERFFAGGGNDVRGYPEDSLGPRNFFGDTTGGSALLILNQEVRFPIAWKFRGVGFVDAGNVFPRIRDLSLSDLRVGYGFGLRIDTPFVLLRADYGFRVRRSPDEPLGRFFFSIGQTF